jgi:hypothetical protein
MDSIGLKFLTQRFWNYLCQQLIDAISQASTNRICYQIIYIRCAHAKQLNDFNGN